MLYLLPQLLERAARKYPEYDAFRFLDQSISYSELDDASTRLAGCLQELGVIRGDRVAIYLNKSLECAIAIYGVLKAGAAYVPLDPGAPASRHCLIIREGGISYLISHDARERQVRQLVDQCGSALKAVVGLSCDSIGRVKTVSWETIGDRKAMPVDCRGRTGDDVAYIMYTSGSTGAPKGIVHTHHSGLSYALMAAELYELTPADRLSNLPPLHFDQSIFDYFSGPAVGACTVIISEAYARLPASLSELMEREKLTVWYSVPFALVQLLLHGVLEQRDLSSLRRVLFGGEPFPTKYLARLASLWPHARFCNVYGPAEVNQCTFHFLPSYVECDQPAVPIGKECPNVELLIVDELDRPVEDGQQGELLVRTPTMMRGYFQRPDLDAEAFFFRENSGGISDRFYRTGDLVINRGGDLYFLGRSDRQVKLRGYRVELDEVEAVFDKHPEVEQSAACITSKSDQHPTLKLAVCRQADSRCSESELRRHAAHLLPAYAVPDIIHFVDEFPRTSSGKIDRNRLCALFENQRDEQPAELSNR